MASRAASTDGSDAEDLDVAGVGDLRSDQGLALNDGGRGGAGKEEGGETHIEGTESESLKILQGVE